MNQEFYHITALLAHLRSPASKATEGYYSAGKASPGLAARVLAITSFDIAGFAIVLDRSGILHALKQHGLVNAASEIAQGQIPVEAADFEELGEWLTAPSIILPGQPRPGQPCIEFQSVRPTGKVCVVLEYRRGRRRLVLTTMYKKSQLPKQLTFFIMSGGKCNKAWLTKPVPPLSVRNVPLPAQIYKEDQKIVATVTFQRGLRR